MKILAYKLFGLHFTNKHMLVQYTPRSPRFHRKFSATQWSGKKNLILVILTGLMILLTAHVWAADQPNIIVIVTDDQGSADVGFQNTERSKDVWTPNLNRLADQGVVFTNAYAAGPTCQPARCSLMTGRNASRFGIEGNGRPDDEAHGLPPSETALPEMLNTLGYRCGAFGKWHLGTAPGMLPTDRGFDTYWGDLESRKDYFMTALAPPNTWAQNGPPADGLYLTTATTDAAVDFIKKPNKQPFFAYIAYNAPHSPFRVKASYVERLVQQRPQFQAAYQRMKAQNRFPDYDFGEFMGPGLDQDILRLVYCSMLLAVDDGVGQILDTLEAQGLRDNTLIFFLSDHGADIHRPNRMGGYNDPHRGGKGDLYEGGLKIPFVISWPDRLPKGERSSILASAMDLFTTSVCAASGHNPTDRVMDGIDLVPYLLGEDAQAIDNRFLFFKNQANGSWAIRWKDFKYIRVRPDKSNPSSSLLSVLFDVRTDPGESIDLSVQLPNIKKRMVNLQRKAKRSMPNRHPNNKPSKQPIP